MIRRPPSSTRTDTLFPYTTLCRSAFAFAYPLVLEGWRRAGAEIAFFSPLAAEAPDAAATAVYLPGGYPELHAGRLAAAAGFLDGLRDRKGVQLGKECVSQCRSRVSPCP